MLLAAIVAAALIALLLLYIATRPNTFIVERSATIAAEPGAIFALIDDFHQWHLWSPWEHLDPAMQKTYSGAPLGPGAIYEWEGNKKAGKGRMEITRSTTPSLVDIKLDFLKPFESHNTSAFTLTPAAGATHVTWTMRGPSPFMMKAMSLFMSMDAMVGKDFERGLQNLKSLTE